VSEREPPQPYRFDELGWLQFERLCLELCATYCNVGIGEWRRAGRGCAVFVPDGIAPPGESRALAAPTLVVVAWIRPANASVAPSQRLRARLEEALSEWSQRRPHSLVVLTNVAAAEMSLPNVEVTVWGSDELTGLVAASWPLRLRVPTVLGIGAAEDLVVTAAAGESTAEIDAARALAPAFVPTRAYAAAVDVLAQHHFVVLTGPPEMGKTAIARTIGLAALTGGWEVHECIHPEELWARFRRERRQVFIADDAFGSTEYRPEAAERWALELDSVLRATDDKHWLIWTSRPAPFKAGLRRIHREHGVERFPQPAQVQVDAANLDAAEKALILFRHAKTASLPPEAVELVKAEGWAIVTHPHFTPERIRRFVAVRLLELSAKVGSDPEIDAAVAAEIREPTEAMAASFRALSDQHRALLVAMLDTPPGPVSERELTAAFRRHSDAGLAQQSAELVDRLTDHFLRLVDRKTVTWVHPSWRDLVIEQLSDDQAGREKFLRSSSLEGVLLALSTAGGGEGERVLPLMRGDRDWDAVGDRLAQLIPTLDDPELTRLFTALAEAQAAITGDERGELDHLAGGALRLVTRRWSGERGLIAIGLLHSWLELARTLADAPPPPELAATWIELAPTAPVDVNVQEEVIRFDDWTMLCELLGAHAPAALARFGFPDEQRQIIDTFVAAVEKGAGDPSSMPRARRELLASILWRLNRVGATDPVHAANVAARLTSVREEPELPEIYLSRPVSPELQRILDAPTIKPRSDEALVARVLGDL
jgi:Novel STAND NTPase 3